MPLPANGAANFMDSKHPIFIENGLQFACVTDPLGSTPPTNGLCISLFVQ